MGRKKLPTEEKDLYWFAYKPKDWTDQAWVAVIESWQNGLSDREAAFRASQKGDKVTPNDIRELLSARPEIADLRDFLLTSLVSESKLNVAEAIRRGDKSMSKWYLERKQPEEFSSKAALQVEAAVAELSMEEKREQAEEFLKQFGGEDGTGTD